MAEESPLSVFESVNVASLRPGDVLLFRCQQRLSNAQRELVIETLNEVFGSHECMVLDAGQDVAVLRPEPGFWRRLAFWRS